MSTPDDKLKEAFIMEDDITRISKRLYDIAEAVDLKEQNRDAHTPRGVSSSEHHIIGPAIQFSILSELRKISGHLGKIAERLGNDNVDL